MNRRSDAGKAPPGMARKGKGSVSSEKAAARAPANAADDPGLRLEGMTLAPTKHGSLIEDHSRESLAFMIREVYADGLLGLPLRLFGHAHG